MQAVQQVRRYTDEPTVDQYTDAELSDRLTAAQGSVAVVCRDIWREKMAAAASLVNTSEGGSSRGNDTLFAKAQNMLAYWTKAANEEANAGGSVSILHRLSR